MQKALEKMGDQQGIIRQITASGVCQILVIILLVTAIVVFSHPSVKQRVRAPSRDMSLPAIRKELLSEKSELGQLLARTVEMKIKGEKTRRKDMVNLASKVAAVDGNMLRFGDLPPLDEYWSKILHFVPKTRNDNCLRMFTTKTSKNIKVSLPFEQLRYKANLELFAGRYARQHDKLTMLYQELARQKFVKTVCEIGFNVGQKAMAWLSSKPGIKYYGFDIGIGATKQMAGNLKKIYPNDFTLTIGDSTKTVPAWIPKGVKCDIVSIDGGHEYPTVIQDIRNMRKAAAKEHILVVDSIYYPGVNKAVKEATASGEIVTLFNCWVPGMDVDVAVGYYKPQK